MVPDGSQQTFDKRRPGRLNPKKVGIINIALEALLCLNFLVKIIIR